MNKQAALLLALGITFAPGCATIVSNGPDHVPVSSTPQGATVTLDGVPVGVTPTTVTFHRAAEGVLKFEKEGYHPTVRDVDKVVNGWVFGNILFGGLIGLTVDLIGSNQGKYSDAPIGVELTPAGSAP